MLDIESALVSYLSESVGVKAYGTPPKQHPERFVTVERTGGSEDVYGCIDYPIVAVQSWGTSTEAALQLAREVDEAMLDVPGEVVNVMSCERNSLYRFPDPDSRRARYQGVYELTTN